MMFRYNTPSAPCVVNYLWIFLSRECFRTWLPQDEDVAAERKKVKHMMAEALEKLADKTVGESLTEEEQSKEVVVLQGLTKVWSRFFFRRELFRFLASLSCNTCLS